MNPKNGSDGGRLHRSVMVRLVDGNWKVVDNPVNCRANTWMRASDWGGSGDAAPWRGRDLSVGEKGSRNKRAQEQKSRTRSEGGWREPCRVEGEAAEGGRMPGREGLALESWRGGERERVGSSCCERQEGKL